MLSATSERPRSAAEPHEVLTDSAGREFELRSISCPICKIPGDRQLGYRGGRFHRYGFGVSTRIVQCSRCELIFPDPFPFPRDPQQLYGDPAKYFARKDESERVEKYREIVREASRKLGGTRKPSLLDIGSGRGEMIEAAHREGLTDVVGLEFSNAMIEYVRKRYGHELLAQSSEDYAEKSKRTFDIIILNAVLEHVYDPDAMMASVRKLTHPGSVVYIDIPQEPNLLTITGNAFNRLRRSPAVLNLSPTWPPYHVYGFNPTSLRTILEKHGMRIESLRIYANPKVPHRPQIVDRLRSIVGTQINRIANMTGMASNMYVWARCS